MPPALPPAQAFWSRLTHRQQTWLAQLRHAVRQPIPSAWLPWFGDGVGLGYISQERAGQLVVQLPHCTMHTDRLLWQNPSANRLQRSRDLQAFLVQQRMLGRLAGWRDEFFCLWAQATCPPTLGTVPWLCVERAGFRHLGMMSHAVHINGFLPDGDLWCGHRADNKATDPGMLDNLTAGGLTAGETPLRTALRELREEAGLDDFQAADLSWVGGVRTQRLESEGWHDEQLLVYNLVVPEGRLPVNTDGEVQAFLRLSPCEVVTRMQAGEFTPDACASLARGLGLMMTTSQGPTRTE